MRWDRIVFQKMFQKQGQKIKGKGMEQGKHGSRGYKNRQLKIKNNRRDDNASKRSQEIEEFS